MTTPTYTWHKHFDYGLLREPPGSLNYEAWCEPQGEQPGLWHRIKFDPFSASMSTITEGMARELIGDGDLYAPTENDRYEQQTREKMARQGIIIPGDTKWDHDD